MNRMWIKICGMSEQAAVDHAAALGVDFCGFVFYPPSPRHVSARHAASLDTHDMRRVGVFVRQDEAEIRKVVHEAGLDYIQLHGGQGVEIAGVFPSEKVIRVLWPAQYAGKEELQADIDAFSTTCGMYLLDAGMGSGMTLDWRALRELRFPHPWFLSGGLSAGNIGRALRECSPDGLDFNSRLEEEPGIKSAALMAQAVSAVREKTKE